LHFFAEALNEEVIPVAAAHASKLGGDARVAIESLLKAGREAERENSEIVKVKHLKKAFESAETVSLLKGVKYLTQAEKTLLQIILEKKEAFSGEIFAIFSKKSSQPLSERRIRDLLNQLEKKGFVTSEQVSLGNKGKTRKFNCRMPKQLLEKELLTETNKN